VCVGGGVGGGTPATRIMLYLTGAELTTTMHHHHYHHHDHVEQRSMLFQSR